MAALLHEAHAVLVAHLLVFHQVGDCEGGAPGYSRSAVNQDGTVLLYLFVHKIDGIVEQVNDALSGVVVDRQLLVFEVLLKRTLQ